MSIAAGLVGLPNVGKSTLFNALTRSSIPAENYPFCTIDPHKACTLVIDPRIEKLQKIFGSKKTMPAYTQFVDIAGLVRGAAEGAGLGNQFLAHIREVNVILHVLRAFEDQNITHTEDKVDPIADYETIMVELGLKDLESIDKRLQKIEQLSKSNKSNPQQTKALTEEKTLLEQVKSAIDQQQIEQAAELISKSAIETVPLLCAKKSLIIANIGEEEISGDTYANNPHYKSLVAKFGIARVIPICAKFEYELAQLSDEERTTLKAELGITHTGLEKIIEKTYETLGLITFFTCGPQEIHAWPVSKGITIRQAAGEIHSDLERGFICADVYNTADLFPLGNTNTLKDLGKIRTEGQAYIVQDGDIVLVKFNV
ncbi:MAG: GTP-binding and nucleic acid-binding protein YchF [candidate division TM6 bacterium GW2011_GWF2_43_17]|nr:MAG: GTP-binding and nucleic acid-binding protein YchF [candidate division TM6 bacterium GW2011_GWF2_43_17]HAU30383.1 redox-regulated ATPase YchF [Candidatus Dependentiae bacterium]